MLRMYILVLVCLAVSSCFGSIAQTSDRKLQAMGLSFGQDLKEAERQGLEATYQDRDGRLTFYRSSKLPQMPSNTDFVTLVFDEQFGLQKISWNSSNVTDDPSGSKGKALYEKVKTSLTEKYGRRPHDEFEKTGLSLYKDWDEFYECLDYEGCGFWVSFWKGDFGSTMLEINSLSRRGSGWIRVVYEGPMWNDIVDQMRAQNDQKDAEAF